VQGKICNTALLGHHCTECTGIINGFTHFQRNGNSAKMRTPQETWYFSPNIICEFNKSKMLLYFKPESMGNLKSELLSLGKVTIAQH
jgi:hypothetical protein